MPDIDDRQESTRVDTPPDWAQLADDPAMLDLLVGKILLNGDLLALISGACEQALKNESTSLAGSGTTPHPGVQAAIGAYAAWKRAKEGSMNTEVRLNPGPGDLPAGEPEVLPLSLAGKWVAWSSDGMRIVAASESSAEAERLAIAAGEPEPILERHPGRYRL